MKKNSHDGTTKTPCNTSGNESAHMKYNGAKSRSQTMQEIQCGPDKLSFNKIFPPSEASMFIPIVSVRAVSVFAWTASILYATYHVYAACEEYLADWFKDPIMNAGPLSSILKRGKDSTDYEWEMFTEAYFTRLWFWYGVYVFMAKTLQPTHSQGWRLISLGLSVVMFGELVGIIPTIFMLLQPFIYWMIAQTRSKSLAWTATILFIYNLNTPIIKVFVPESNFAQYFFVITSAWNYARCISFCYDIWERNQTSIGLIYLENVTRYCFYLPLAISGPLVSYEDFEKYIINKDVNVSNTHDATLDLRKLIRRLGKISIIALFNELILHLLYFRALSMTANVHKYLSLWAVCGTIYWLGQFFAMKYKVLYGVPTVIAEFDGMKMPPLPTCPSHMHRYSALWREFDAGLYRFLVKYIYVPSLKFIQEKDTSKKIPVDLQKLMASFISYVYVFIWHSLSFDVFVWTVLNFVGITIERIGSVIKREIDKRMHIEQICWDFIIEPIVTVPLAGMSILNSSIFCGSMDAAVSFSSVLWKRRDENWVFLFLYFFTHTAVTYRTWRHKLNLLFKGSCARNTDKED